MCNVCGRTPCSKKCPNSDVKRLYYCDKCGTEIYEGDVFYQIEVEGYVTQLLCEDCVTESKRYAESEE